ncbi:hypothetical protein MY8738_009190 [Beauveria namnaoensis]
MSRSSRTYTIGVEIEGILAAARPLQDPHRCYQRLVEELRRLGESAVVNRRPKSRAADYYNTDWAVTSDASLQAGPGQVGFEAVSPIYQFQGLRWDHAMSNFAQALRNSPFTLVPHDSASTHVHVKTAQRNFSLDELKTICFASIVYEWHIFQMMPFHRESSLYCRGVMQGSGSIKRLFPNGLDSGESRHVRRLRQEIQQIRDAHSLVAFVQGDTRHMLWNFSNIIKVSGTIEFRGGGQGTSPSLYTNCNLLPWYSRILQHARRALMSILRLQQPSRYVSHTSTRFAALDIGYLIIETVTSGEMLSESWEENRDNPKLLENLQRGLARIMLSLASVNLPHIGSFRLDHNGYLRLDNRPWSVQTAVHENEDLPLDLPRQATLPTSKDLILSQLSAFDNRLLNQPNAVVSREDAWYQMTSLATAKLALPQLLRQEYVNGPFTLTLTDLHRSNVFVDGNWNITCIIDLEFACSWPIDFLQTPYWFDADFIDQISPDKFASRHSQFMKYLKKVEQLKDYRGNEEPLSSIMNQSWEKGTFWIPLALRDAVAYTTIFYQKILPKYFNFPTEELNDGAYTRFCCCFWSPSVPSVIDGKLRDRDDHLTRLKQAFAEPA